MTLQIRDATQPFAGCYQVQFFGLTSDKVAGYRESEDCLFVNVWVPSNATRDSSLPVLVWLYGGGFVSGHTEPREGVKFVSEHRDIIFVSFNYRTNIFGFPGSDAVEAKNAGLLDQRLALEWIRDNIGSFGGDSSRITFMGVSAGSMSVSAYAFAYADDPIVSGLIHMSGQATSIDPAGPEQWLAVVNRTNCLAGGDTVEEQLRCMKELPPRELRRGISASNLIPFGDDLGLRGSATLAPVVDNVTVFSAAEYLERGRAGQFAHIPMFSLSTLHEGDGISPFDPTSDPAINYTLSDVLTAVVFHCPTAAATSFFAAAGVPTYRALYSGTFAELQPYPWARAYHGADAFLFMGAENTYAYEDVGDDIINAGRLLRAAVAAFVRDPADGLAAELAWPRYDPTNVTLVNLFADNTPSFTVEDPVEYDLVCEALPASESFK